MKIQTTTLFYALAILSGCAPALQSHVGNLHPGEEVRPGLYALSASTNSFLAPSQAGAEGMFSAEAAELCGDGQYQIFISNQEAHATGPSVVMVGPGRFLPTPLYKTTVNGYVLCNSAGLNKDEAMKIVNSIPKYNPAALATVWQAQLDELGGSNCTASKQASAENLTKRGQLLKNQSRYKEAFICLSRAVEQGEKARLPTVKHARLWEPCMNWAGESNRTCPLQNSGTPKQAFNEAQA